MLVDDDVDLAEILTEALQLEGIELHIAETEPEALALVKRVEPKIVLVDYQIPGIEPRHLIRELRKACPCRVVLCTGMGNAGSLALAMGADGVLVKPFHIEELLALAKGQPVAAP